MADQYPTDAVAQLHLVLDNMPGALVYTDADLRIVVCNDRFKEMYQVPPELAAARPALCRSAALPGRARLLRRGRRRCPGREARGEPAQSFGAELRGSHAGRPVVSHSAPPRGGRWRCHGDDGHHRPEAGRAGSVGKGSPAPCRARQHAGRARLHGCRSENRRLQQPLQGDVHRPAGAAATRPPLCRSAALSG